MSIKILTVDDSRTIRMIIQRAFRLFDCTFCEAADGAQGLEVASREKPDLIILDITMPVMDGFTMLGQLRQHPEIKSTPVVMLTAESSRENIEHVDKLGISDYVVKPFKEDVLLETVRKILPLTAKAA